MKGTVLQLNLKPLTGQEPGLPKRPAASARLTKEGFEGDYNRYRREKRNGNPDMAVLLMPVETLRELQGEGWPVRPGDVGENITSEGIAYSDFSVGARIRVGEAQIQVAEPCTPCQTLRHLSYVGPDKIARFVRLMLGRRGWYCRVLKEGVVRAGDEMELLDGGRGFSL